MSPAPGSAAATPSPTPCQTQAPLSPSMVGSSPAGAPSSPAALALQHLRGRGGAVAAGILLVGGIGLWWHHNWNVQETDNAQLQAHLYRVSSRIPGTVASVLVEDHQQVQSGQPLVQLDSSDQHMAIRRAEADLAVAQRQAEAAQGTVSAGLSQAEASRDLAQGTEQEARAELERAQADLSRWERLYRQGATSQQQVDLARSQARQAEGQISRSSGTRATAQAAQATMAVERRRAAAAAAAVAQARAALDTARLQLSYTTVRAPARSRVGQREAEPGQGVQPGLALMTLVGERVWVEANFKETQVSHMQVHDRAEVQIDGLPGVGFQGQVTSLAPASGARFALLPPENATGNFTKVVQRVTVRIDLDPRQLETYRSRLRPGLSATVRVHT